MQRPFIRMAQHYKKHFVFVKLFGNANHQTKTIFKDGLRVRSTPSFMILRDGEVVETQVR
jgi:hypothetical protein